MNLQSAYPFLARIATGGIFLLFIVSGLARQNEIQAFAPFSSSSQTPRTTIPSSKQMSGKEQLVKANTQFGFKLFSAIVSQDKNENVFVSPTSIAIALDILYNGAHGTTQQEMTQALTLHGISLEELNTTNQALQEALQKTDEQVQKRDRQFSMG